MSEPIGNGSFPAGTPWWVRLALTHGAFFFLVLFLLGVFDFTPWVKSPISRLIDGLKDSTAAQTESIRDLKKSVDLSIEQMEQERQQRQRLIKAVEGLSNDLYATRPTGTQPSPPAPTKPSHR